MNFRYGDPNTCVMVLDGDPSTCVIVLDESGYVLVLHMCDYARIVISIACV